MSNEPFLKAIFTYMFGVLLSAIVDPVCSRAQCILSYSQFRCTPLKLNRQGAFHSTFEIFSDVTPIRRLPFADSMSSDQPVSLKQNVHFSPVAGHRSLSSTAQ